MNIWDMIFMALAPTLINTAALIIFWKLFKNDIRKVMRKDEQ